MGRRPKPPAGSDAQPEAPAKQGKRVPAIFFRTEAGREPVRDWLKTLPYPDDRKRIGEDIKTVEFGWPIGMPVGLWARGSMRSAPISHTTGLPAFCSTSIARAEW